MQVLWASLGIECHKPMGFPCRRFPDPKLLCMLCRRRQHNSRRRTKRLETWHQVKLCLLAHLAPSQPWMMSKGIPSKQAQNLGEQLRITVQLIMYQTWITAIDFATNQVHAICQLSRIVRVANAASTHSKIRKQPATFRRITDAQLTLLQIKFIFKELLKDDQHPKICHQLLTQKKAQSQTVHWAA